MNLRDLYEQESSRSVADLGDLTKLYRESRVDHFNNLPVLDLSNKRLTSLRGCPSHVKGSLWVHHNQLASLEGISSFIGRGLDLSNNYFTSLKDIHKHIKKMDGSIWITGNPIKSHLLGILLIDGCKGYAASTTLAAVIKIINKYAIINANYRVPGQDLYECQTELIENGLEEFAEV